MVSDGASAARSRTKEPLRMTESTGPEMSLRDDMQRRPDGSRRRLPPPGRQISDPVARPAALCPYRRPAPSRASMDASAPPGGSWRSPFLSVADQPRTPPASMAGSAMSSMPIPSGWTLARGSGSRRSTVPRHDRTGQNARAKWRSARRMGYQVVGRNRDRLVAKVWLGRRDLGKLLVEIGAARPWPRGKPKPDWCR